MNAQPVRQYYRPGPENLDFVQKLGLDNAFSLGFLPRPALQGYAALGSIIVARENGEPAGFLVHRPKLSLDPRVTGIMQVCVVNDARRLDIATSLVKLAAEDAAYAGTTILQGWCATDLESNEFWKAIGFQAVGQRPGGLAKLKRRRYHTLWRIALEPSADIHAVAKDPRRGPGGLFIRPN